MKLFHVKTSNYNKIKKRIMIKEKIKKTKRMIFKMELSRLYNLSIIKQIMKILKFKLNSRKFKMIQGLLYNLLFKTLKIIIIIMKIIKMMMMIIIIILLMIRQQYLNIIKLKMFNKEQILKILTIELQKVLTQGHKNYRVF